MAEQTRVVTIEFTVIDDSDTFVPAEKTVEWWRTRLSDADDVHVTVKDFIQDEED